MLTVTSAQLSAWLAAFIWPFARILAVVATEPIFGNRVVPARAKIGLAFVLTLVLFPALEPATHIDPGSADGLLVLMQQVVIGIAIGLTMRIVVVSVEMAGHLIGLQMGLGFATFFDPQNAAQTPVMGSFIGIFAVLMFLSMNGHLMLIATLAESFHTLPISASPFAAPGWRTLAQWGGQIFLVGVLLSLPVVAALLITNLAIGIMTRAAPQLNIFAVGFPITIAAGFVILFLTLPYFAPALDRLWNDGLVTALQILRDARPAGGQP